MKNKGGVVLLTVVVSLLCIYYLSFTFVAQRVNEEATAAATVDNTTDYAKKQQYLDSIWKEPVYNLFGIEFTYQDIKETELNLGLDLRGGMHVTLEVSPEEIVKGVSGNSKDPDFLKALAAAKEKIKGTQLNYVAEFYASFKELAPDKSLAAVFATAANRGRISLSTPDEEVLALINEEVDGAIERSFNILRTRIDRFGTSQPNIQRLQGTGRIQIELPGVDNPTRVRKLLQGVAKLEFWEVHEINEIFPTLQAMNDVAVKDQQAELSELVQAGDTTTVVETKTENIDDLLGDNSPADSTAGDDLVAQLENDSTALDSAALASQVSPLFSLLQAQYGLIYNLKDTAKINRVLQNEDVKRSIPSTIKFLWAVKPVKSQDVLNQDEFIELYAIKTSRGGKAPLTGEVIIDARQELDQRSAPSIGMNMNATGAKAWKKLTADNINRRVAIVLDGYVYSAPNVQGEIPNGSSQITGNFTLEEAKDLANILKAGSLPAPTTIVEDVVIGPTLGKVAQQQGIISIVAGLGIVILFMIAYYAKGGMVANIALFFNVFFILGILAQLSAALTLPGIAGIVLTIGMSIDANVLIFERIKEELRNGAGVKQAISSGYSKAYSSIVDANVTTLLVGFILYFLGQGPVKGFAITLIVGIICSFFSAVFITRVITEWMSKKGDKSKISFSTPFSKNFLTNINFDFISKRKMAYIFSATFITIGMIALIGKGLTYGVDFTGGRSYVVTFQNPIVPSALKTSLSGSLDNQGVEVKTFGADNILKVTTSYLIEDESDEADVKVKETVVAGIADFTKLTYIEDDTKADAGNFTIASSSKVGATIADDIKNASFESVVFALIVIFLYILVRFRKWQFGLGAIIALFHDTLFVLSAFAIANLLGFSFEVDQVFIAAMLTIIGYSINDTVVVFDRVRETLSAKQSTDMKSVFNEALNSTVSRTTITSLTTLIVVIVLFLFGGAVLQGFSFALIVGILIGTYSSIFIATPVVIDFNKEKK
ncbi:protein translocase subunit SecDF [Reichenbachiella agarivorans]|uniref:Multifunctional fusion protein n=1 Tax=Reichenbachiella agarivorans TaxID=2979464 RepID=A0ABY6CR46_9BACT|nr:protein translocase subunit SecDF [Reichenbachiella agarivorans]UXP32971.1 protein translocase subunit SecDF [Reichenbachiella agarivorans]